jgi:alkylation response protein AidB-like acyl-CoA dehydrogenase
MRYVSASRARREDVATQSAGFVRLARAAADIDSAFVLASSGAAQLDRLAEGETLGELEGARYRRNQAYAVQPCRGAVNSLIEAGGGSALYESNALQRYWRDMNAASAHTSSNWENAAVGYGYAGAGPESAE